MLAVIRAHVRLAVLLAVALAIGCAPASRTVAGPSATASAAGTATPSPKTSPSKTQPQLPLPTHVRWATDKGSPDDPRHRPLLVLFYDGAAQGWRIVDVSGVTVVQIPIAGSGMFGPDTCVARAAQSQDVATWAAIEPSQLEHFTQNYRSYRAVAEGVPNGTVTLELVDSGCHKG